MRKNTVLIILFILVIIGIWGMNNQLGDPEAPEKGAKNMQAYFYDVAFSSSGWVDSGKLLSGFTGNAGVSAKETFTTKLKYRLVIQPLSDKQLIVSLTDISTTTGVDLSALYSPVLIAQGNDGNLSVDTEQFDYDPQLFDLISTSIEKIQFKAASKEVTEWTAAEQDQFGRYLAHYKLLSQKQGARLFQKTKRDYAPIGDQQSLFGGQGGTVEIENSSTEISVSPTGHSVISASGQETIAIHSAQGQTAELHHVITLELGTERTPTTQWHSLKDLSHYYESRSNQSRSAEPLATSFEHFTDQLSWFESTVQEDEVFAIDQMILWLKRNPEEAGSLVHYLSENIYNINQEVELRLWYALVEAGNAPIQQAFAQIISNSNSDSLALFRILSYSHDFSEPTEQLIESLWRASEQFADGNQDEQELSSMALYVLGSLMKEGGPETMEKQRLLKAYQARLEAPGGLPVAQTAALILGVGNSQRVEMLPALAPYFSFTDPQISGAAFEALTHFPAASVNDLFIEEYREIESEEVKEQALQALEKLEPNKTLNHWVAQQLEEPLPRNEFTVFVDYLGKSVDSDSDSEVAIRNLLTKELSVERKSLIYNYIKPALGQ